MLIAGVQTWSFDLDRDRRAEQCGLRLEEDGSARSTEDGKSGGAKKLIPICLDTKGLADFKAGEHDDEERYRALLAGVTDVVMRFARDGRHLFVSENVEAVTGIPRAWARNSSAISRSSSRQAPRTAASPCSATSVS